MTVRGPLSKDLPAACHTHSAPSFTQPRLFEDTAPLLALLDDLFQCWQGEAQASQEMHEGLIQEMRLGVRPNTDAEEVHVSYWRGRRDGFESAAYELLVALDGRLEYSTDDRR